MLVYVFFRLQRLEHLADKFKRKAEKIEGWTDGKDTVLQRDDDLQSANLADIQVCVSDLVCVLMCVCDIQVCVSECVNIILLFAGSSKDP